MPAKYSNRVVNGLHISIIKVHTSTLASLNCTYLKLPASHGPWLLISNFIQKAYMSCECVQYMSVIVQKFINWYNKLSTQIKVHTLNNKTVFIIQYISEPMLFFFAGGSMPVFCIKEWYVRCVLKLNIINYYIPPNSSFSIMLSRYIKLIMIQYHMHVGTAYLIQYKGLTNTIIGSDIVVMTVQY